MQFTAHLDCHFIVPHSTTTKIQHLPFLPSRQFQQVKKMLLIMRLTVILVLAACLKVSAAGYAQEITLRAKDMTCESVFREITRQSGYQFFFNKRLIRNARNVSVELNAVPVEKAIEICLADQPFDFAIVNKTVVIRKKEQHPAEIPNAPPVPSPPADISLSGRVTNAKKEPLEGVSVTVKGTQTGTTTDADGWFRLSVPSAGNVELVFSFVGYASQTVKASSQTVFNIIMEEAVSDLADVVVVGYGTQKKVNLTGAVSTVTSKDLSVVPTPNVSTLLYGNLPGLIPLQRSGEPGSDNVSLSIRGFSNPLIVIDGIQGRDFSRLDPNEIESITILKDAASASVYGVSGGNGVILVTTKRGKTGKPTASYTINYGLQSFSNFPSVVNSAEYAMLKNEAAVNARQAPLYSDEEIRKYADGTDPNYPDFNYTDYMMHKYFPQLEQNISIRGGSDKIKYFFLLGQTSQSSVWKGVNGGKLDFGKYNFRSNIDASITKDLDISVDLGARIEDRNNLVNPSFQMFSWYMYQTPIALPKNPDGTISDHAYGLTAYLDRDLTGYIKDQRSAYEAALTIKYKIPFIKGLSANIKAAHDRYFQDNKRWTKTYYVYSWDAAAQASIKGPGTERNELILGTSKTSASRIQSSLNYENSFGANHHVKGLLLYEISENQATNFQASRTGYEVPIDQIFAGPSSGKNNSGGASDDGRKSYIGRINYDYADKYLFEYSFRYDGSPKFPPDKRWGYFSGLSAGWRISEENFIKNNFTYVDNLKLRGSWGTLGSDNTGNFQFLAGYNYPAGSYIYTGNTITSGMIESGTPNPNITWEKSRIINLGLELSLWKRLLQVETDVFYRKRYDLLARRTTQLPSTFGATLPAENLNADDARGFEVLLGHSYNIGEIRYSISTNFSYTRLKNRHLEQRTFTDQYDNWRNNMENRWSNIKWAYRALGQFQSMEEILSSPIQDQRQNSTLLPGDLKYQDFNGDGIINQYDMQPIARGSLPELNYGFGINAGWKRFSIIINFQGASRSNIQSLYGSVIEPFQYDHTAYKYFLDRWHLADPKADPRDPNAAWIPGKYSPTLVGGNPNNALLSTWLLEPITYLRLKSVAISYDLKNLIKKVGIQDMFISLSAQNLLTFSSLRESSFDPEASGERYTYYPQIKTYNLSFNIKF
jgi:TonB-linked SusC/RagA family outer membrane protein